MWRDRQRSHGRGGDRRNQGFPYQIQASKCSSSQNGNAKAATFTGDNLHSWRFWRRRRGRRFRFCLWWWRGRVWLGLWRGRGWWLPKRLRQRVVPKPGAQVRVLAHQVDHRDGAGMTIQLDESGQLGGAGCPGLRLRRGRRRRFGRRGWLRRLVAVHASQGVRVNALVARDRVPLDGELVVGISDHVANLPSREAGAPRGFLQADDAGQLADLLGRRLVGRGEARNGKTRRALRSCRLVLLDRPDSGPCSPHAG